MRNIQKFAVAVGIAVGASSAMAQTKWDLPSGYAHNTFQVETVASFIKDVEGAAGGKLNIQLHPGGSLYKANEIKRAIQTGQVQIGQFILSGLANENPLFGVESVPFLVSGYPDAKRLAELSRPAIEDIFDKQGMKLLFTTPWPGQSLFSNKPINSGADLRGTKMRTYDPTTNRIAQLLRAQPATIQLSELGQALATGAVDNLITSSATGVESKLFESVKHFYPINAFIPKNAVVVSKKAFAALDKATQDAVLKAAADAETRGWKVSEEKNAEFLKALADNGMTVSEPSPALRKDLAAIGETMTAEWLRTAGDEGKKIIDAYKK